MLRTDMKKFKIITLPGDGIGPEITSSAVKILNAISDLNDIEFEIVEKYVGGISIDKYGNPVWYSKNDNFSLNRILATQFLENGNIMGFAPGIGYEFSLNSDIEFETSNAGLIPTQFLAQHSSQQP